MLPNHNLKFFINGIKCLTHFNVNIEPETNQFKMEFEAPKDVTMIGKIFTMNNTEINNALFVQRDFKSGNIIIDIAIQTNDITKL